MHGKDQEGKGESVMFRQLDREGERSSEGKAERRQVQRKTIPIIEQGTLHHAIAGGFV